MPRAATRYANPLKAKNVADELSKPRPYPKYLRRCQQNDYLGERWIRWDPYGSFLPKRPCCYVLFVNGIAVYVGQTMNLRARIQAHKTDGMLKRLGTEGVTMKAHFGYRYGDWLMREARLILKLQPIHNQRGCY